MILLFLVCYLFDPFSFVGIKDMHNIYYLGLSGEHGCPLGYLFFLISALASYPGGEAYGAEAMPTVPEFDTVPKNVTAIAGQTISLQCSIEYKNEYKVGLGKRKLVSIQK